MKQRILAVLAAGAALAIAGCGLQGSPSRRASHPTGPAAVERVPAEWVPGLAEVATLSISLGRPVDAADAPQPLYATHPRHRERIALLLDMLTNSRLAAGEISPPSRAPVLHVALKDGKVISARLAYNCTPFSSEGGHGYTCRKAPGDLILHTRQGREVRVANPPLAQWLLHGWRRDIPVGVAPEIDRETALEIARDADPKARWKATFYEEYPVEGRGGTEVRRAWLMEAEYPTGSKTRLVIDAVSGEIIRMGQLESLP